MSENLENKDNAVSERDEIYSLNDDRRVKVLSPGALVAKRFFRNTLSVVGLVMIIAMFIFSFIGGFASPYAEDEIFYTYTDMKKNYVTATRNDAFRYAVADGEQFSSTLQAKFQLAYNNNESSFTYQNVTYDLSEDGTDLYTITTDDTVVAIAFKDIVNAPDDAAETISFDLRKAALSAYTNNASTFELNGQIYTVDKNGNVKNNDTLVAYISRFIVQAAEPGVNITREFKEKLEDALESDSAEFRYIDQDDAEAVYEIEYKPASMTWNVMQDKSTYVKMTYASPSKTHPLGTDSNGMDMLTRLMYGGRVSLIIGFIVVFIGAFLGVIMGGISGYFGGWVDNLIMRIVDIFYCIPSTPLIIILGAAMDAMQVEPRIRMLYLMLILGFLSWPGIARLIRGQILSLREQEFMTATEACGISVQRRIFHHLIPNVIPQLIVICTMDLGSTILTEATLSFLGLGVKFPFASWGNIISDVNNSFVMTNYWFIWIPAGICLLISVLGFNFIGDGLRDAFDPKMKR
ncbi:MAG: ABC transporter permease [Clostridia bacterium]|nr:ABC transporter permease [Clostridia bacterium]